ncbi:MAG: hypothetical protein AAF327_11925 [Cyanobacteria bacterium P01_A01_bin.37]
MTVILCPGIHHERLTQNFLEQMSPALSDPVVFSTNQYPAYSAWHLIQCLETSLDPQQLETPILFIGFSAGVVAAIATAWYWQLKGRSVKALIALDGWGIPLRGTFPIHRMSHDLFTHWSSTIGETRSDCFYAEPSVDHLDLWRSPASTQGQWVKTSSEQSSSWLGTCRSAMQSHDGQATHRQTTAAEFLMMLLQQYGELSSQP